MAQQVTTLKKQIESHTTQVTARKPRSGRYSRCPGHRNKTNATTGTAQDTTQKNNATTQNALAATKPPRSQLAHPSHHPTRPSHHSTNMPNSTIPSDRKALLHAIPNATPIPNLRYSAFLRVCFRIRLPRATPLPRARAAPLRIDRTRAAGM